MSYDHDPLCWNHPDNRDEWSSLWDCYCSDIRAIRKVIASNILEGVHATDVECEDYECSVQCAAYRDAAAIALAGAE